MRHTLVVGGSLAERYTPIAEGNFCCPAYAAAQGSPAAEANGLVAVLVAVVVRKIAAVGAAAEMKHRLALE